MKVDIEPIIQLDNTVETKLRLEVSKVIEEVEVAGTRALTIQTTNAETVLTIKDGVQTILGGLFEQDTKESKTTIPFIGEIPFIGDAFSSFSNTDIKREILLSITPYIIKQVAVPDLDVATIWSGGEDNLKNGPNFGSFAEPLFSDIETTKPLVAPGVKPLKIEKLKQEAEVSVIVGEIEAGNAATEKVATETEMSVETPIVGESSSVDSLASEEAVPLEVLSEQVEIVAPIVLPMPEKGPASINFSGPKEVKKGSMFSVAVQVKGVEQLYSAPLFVKYDPAILELMSLNEGVFLKQDGQSTVFSSSPNRTTGQVIVGYKQGTGGKGASGAGVLFNLNFKALTEGEATLEVNRVNFRNPEGVRLQVVPETVTIEIR